MHFKLKDITEVVRYGANYHISAGGRLFIFIFDDHCAVECSRTYKIIRGDTEAEAEWLQNLEWYIEQYEVPAIEDQPGFL